MNGFDERESMQVDEAIWAGLVDRVDRIREHLLAALDQADADSGTAPELHPPPVLSSGPVLQPVVMDSGPAFAEDRYLSTDEVARLLNVSPRSVSRWADAGRIQHRFTLGGHRRFHPDTVSFLRGSVDNSDRTAQALPAEEG
jgi:excisionase family DNA binding protein